jgi:hypothetical protein
VFPIYSTNAIGSVWGDVDNDGDLDLVTASNSASEALFLNSGPPGYTFTRVLTGDLVSSGGSSFGCSLADMDRDGDLDVFVANTNNENDFLFRNDGPAGHWLTLRLRGNVNRSAIGARARVRATIGGVPRWMMQEVMPQSGYNSQNPELHFGLGDATSADSIDVRWPNGTHDISVNVAGDRWLAIVQGTQVGVGDGPRARVGLAIRSVTPNPSRGALRVAFSVPGAGAARVELIDVSGRRVAQREIGTPNGGENVIQLAPERVAAGVYVVRLIQGRESVSTRAVVTR